MKPLIFIGSNSNLETYIDVAQLLGYSIAGIIDQDYYGNTSHLCNIPVIDSEQNLKENISYYLDNFNFFIATNWSSDPSQARDIQKRLTQINLCEELGIQCVNLIDPSARIIPPVKLGSGIYLGCQVVVEANCTIGDYAQIWHLTVLTHHSTLGKNSVINRNSGISAKIGNDVYIGMCVNAHGVTINDNAIVDPSFYVKRDVDYGERIKLTKDLVQYNRIYPRYVAENIT